MVIFLVWRFFDIAIICFRLLVRILGDKKISRNGGG